MVIESALTGICRVLADKIVLFCAGSKGSLTEWHLKAFDDREGFLAACAADERLAGADAPKLKATEGKVNAADTCEELLQAL